MRWVETRFAWASAASRVVVGGCLGAACVSALASDAAHPAEAPFRYRAPISVQRDAAFVQLPLAPAVYGRSLQPGLRDLRVVDSAGERVPFALLAPRAGLAQTAESQREATLYPLPRKLVNGESGPSPLEVTVQGDRITVKQRVPAAASSVSPTPSPAPGWLFDLGERRPGEPEASSLLLAWSGPAEFTAGYRSESSDDLRSWRDAGGGQVMALASPRGALTQPRVTLPAGVGRFVRLVWSEPAAAPLLTRAQGAFERVAEVALDAPHEWQVAPMPEPVGEPARAGDAAKRALYFDLGGALPLRQIDLELGAGTRVAPVRLQGRDTVGEAWRDLAGTVFFRLEREGSVSRSPALPLNTTLRFLRVVPDERAPALDATETRLMVRAALPSLVFASQGRPPFSLLAGSADAAAGALPAQTLVLLLDQERTRFGTATLGDWREVPEAVQRAETEARNAALRPWLLWAVLLLGVAGLGFMVWRLARGAAKPA